MTELEYRKIRSHINFSVRTFFHDNLFIELETPSLSPALIPERHIDVFSTDDEEKTKQYLVPSPEVHLKPLIAAMAAERKTASATKNMRGVFELAHSFRKNEVIDEIHKPEFIMLEWYELDVNYIDSQQRCLDLIEYLFKNTESVSQKCKQPKICHVTMHEAFEQYAKIDLSRMVEMTDVPTMCEEFAINLNDSQRESYDWEDVFHYVFVTLVEPHIPKDSLFFITDYPSRLPTLAKQKHNDNQISERWELYAGGVELANCYTEETSPQKINAFFENQYHQGQYKSCGVRKSQAAMPKNFIQKPSLPPCSGVALGIDRLIAFLCRESKKFGI